MKFFANQQIKNVQSALSFAPATEDIGSLANVVQLLNDRWQTKDAREASERAGLINDRRKTVYSSLHDSMGRLKQQLAKLGESADVRIQSRSMDHSDAHYFTGDIIQVAKKHEYYFQRDMPRAWFRIRIQRPDELDFNFIVSMHHFGYGDDSLAVASFLKWRPIEESTQKDWVVELAPFTLSLLTEVSERTKSNIDAYLQDALTIGLAFMLSET